MNIYVGNLSLHITEEELRREFMAFGAVGSVVVMNNQYIGSGQTRGYGFVEMDSKSEGNAAIISLKGKRLKNQAIDVVEALSLSDKTPNNPDDAGRNRRSSSRVRQRKG